MPAIVYTKTEVNRVHVGGTSTLVVPDRSANVAPRRSVLVITNDGDSKAYLNVGGPVAEDGMGVPLVPGASYTMDAQNLSYGPVYGIGASGGETYLSTMECFE